MQTPLIDTRTPRSEGFSMPAEWTEHQACILEWPTRAEVWGPHFDDAKSDYAAVARAIADFEPVLMVARPEDAADVRNRCGASIEVLPAPLDDSWARDNGPIFVTNRTGELAVVDFIFNAWGEKYEGYDNDARIPSVIASHLGVPRYEAPFVLEGGAFFVDGEGTLITTRQCLLHENRNPGLGQPEIEELLREYLGVDTIIWLSHGMADDSETDGHIDGVLQYVKPGVVMHLRPLSPNDPGYAMAEENLDELAGATDASGRKLEVIEFEPVAYPGLDGGILPIPYANSYLPNGGVIFPLANLVEEDEAAARRYAEVFPDREIVGVPGLMLSLGGGGPHCITQQVPVSRP